MNQNRSGHFVTGAVESRQPGYDFFATGPRPTAPATPTAYGQGKARAEETKWGGHGNSTQAASEFLANGGRF